MKTNKNDFPDILESYFNIHLKVERHFSDNTYVSYLNTIKQYIDYLETKDIGRIKLSFNDISKENVLDYLNHYQNEKGWSTKTRNHHLSVIKSFMEYAQSVNPVYIKQYLEIKSIKVQRDKKKVMNFMTAEELNCVLSECNLSSKSGYKHFMMLSLLYETGCRVSELINIKVKDINLNKDSYIRILGKGNKERIVYISDTTVKILNKYMEDFHISEGYLFLNHSNKQFSRYGVNKMVTKYVELAKEKNSTLREKNITPHSFRHTKAVHFLLNGTALPIIQRFLGHNQIQTTEGYLAVTSDVVINAVNEVSKIIDYKTDEEALWKGDKDLLELLNSFKK